VLLKFIIESQEEHLHVSVCVCCCSTVCRLQTSWSTILSVCTSKKSLMDAVSNQWIAAGFVGLVFTGRLEFANKNGLWLDHTLSSCGLLLIPGLSSCRHVMVYVLPKLSWQNVLRTEDTLSAFCSESNENHKELLPCDFLQKGLILFCQFWVYCWI